MFWISIFLLKIAVIQSLILNTPRQKTAHGPQCSVLSETWCQNMLAESTTKCSPSWNVKRSSSRTVFHSCKRWTTSYAEILGSRCVPPLACWHLVTSSPHWPLEFSKAHNTFVTETLRCIHQNRKYFDCLINTFPVPVMLPFARPIYHTCQSIYTGGKSGRKLI